MLGRRTECERSPRCAQERREGAELARFALLSLPTCEASNGSEFVRPRSGRPLPKGGGAARVSARGGGASAHWQVPVVNSFWAIFASFAFFRIFAFMRFGKSPPVCWMRLSLAGRPLLSFGIKARDVREPFMDAPWELFVLLAVWGRPFSAVPAVSGPMRYIAPVGAMVRLGAPVTEL